MAEFRASRVEGSLRHLHAAQHNWNAKKAEILHAHVCSHYNKVFDNLYNFFSNSFIMPGDFQTIFL